MSAQETQAHAPAQAPGLSQTPGALDTLWAAADRDWDNEKVHVALLEFALRENRLADLAAKYRAQTAVPERAPLAKRRLDALTVAAMQWMAAAKTPKRERMPQALVWTTLTISISLILFAWWGVFGRLGR
jgi:hypothetical protein